MINKQTCEFVSCFDLFDGYRPLFDEIAGDGCPFTWGDNNRSLVTVSRILDHLSEITEEPEETFNEFEARCQEVGLQTYVDLEN